MANRYDKIIEWVFNKCYKKGATEVAFGRDLIEQAASELQIVLPKNLGDVVYTYRYRKSLPESVNAKAPQGLVWVIRPAGKARYKFVAVGVANIVPTPRLRITKVPEATPELISAYALGDEQALLAKLRYNRLLDLFLRLTCYSLQNHLRTQVEGLGQIEVDEVYLGVDRFGAHHIIPVQAKGGKDKLSVVQIEQDLAFCAKKFPQLICRPVGAQFMSDDQIALMEFGQEDDEIVIVSEAHYRLVPHEGITAKELRDYARLSGSGE